MPIPEIATLFDVHYQPGISNEAQVELIEMLVEHIVHHGQFELFDFEKQLLVSFIVSRSFPWNNKTSPYTYFTVAIKNWLFIHRKSVERPGTLAHVRRKYMVIWERVKMHTSLG